MGQTATGAKTRASYNKVASPEQLSFEARQFYERPERSFSPIYRRELRAKSLLKHVVDEGLDFLTLLQSARMIRPVLRNVFSIQQF